MAKVAITEQYLTDIADAIREKTGLTNLYYPSQMAPAILTISGSGGITPTGTISITSNGTYNVTQYASANVNVPTGTTILNQDKTVTPTESVQIVSYDSGYTGLEHVTIRAIDSEYVGSGITRNTSSDLTVDGANISVPAGYYEEDVSISVASGIAGTPTAIKGTVSNYSLAVTPSVTNTTGYITGGTKNGTAVTVSASELVSGTLSVTSNGTKDVTNYANVSVNVPTGSTINNQDKTVNPSISAQEITADSGYTGLGIVTVNAMPTMTLPTTVASSATSGYTKKLTISRSTAKQYVNIPTGYNSVGAYYEIDAVADGSVGTPSATKGTVSNYSISVTPSVSYTAGYIAGGSKSGTVVTVSASELVSGTLSITSNGTKDVTNYASVNVNISGDSPTIESLEITPSESEQTFNSTSVDGYKPVTVGAISSTYVGSGITQRSSSDLTASGATITTPAGYYSATATYTMPSKDLSANNITLSLDSETGIVSAYASITSTQVGYYASQTTGNKTLQLTLKDSDDLTVSGAIVTVPAGYYNAAVNKSVASGSATGPTSLSSSNAAVTTGTNTITLTKTGVATTPTVSAGYVSDATTSTATIALTASITTKAAATITPGTTNQTIASGTYLTGTQTIVGDEDLIGSNILSTANIFGVQGTVVVQNYYTGSSAPSSSLGQNGDIYIQS